MHYAMENVEWPRDPYKGLANYESEDEDLFAGRDAEIDACAQLLSNSQTKLLILHGQTGCGKSSFLRAGLIPALERNGAGYLFLRRPAAFNSDHWIPSFIRCGADPLSRIAEEIFVFTTQPIVVRMATGPKEIDLTPVRLGIDYEDEFIKACADPHQLVQVLERLSLALPHTFLLILDQAEEVITLNSSGTDNQSRFSRFIKELTTSDIDMRLVLAIRKDHSGQFIGSIQVDNEMSPAIRTFFLSGLSNSGVREAILRPTLKSVSDGSMKGAPFEHYQFAYAPEVVEAIILDLDTLIPAGATLPVMQIVCRDLYEQISLLPLPRLIKLPLYQQGAIKGRVKRHVINSLREMLDRNKSLGNQRDKTELKWLRVLKKLVQEEGDGRVHTDVVPKKALEEWAVNEGIKGDVSAVIDGLTDPKMLVLRKFTISAPGSTSERELYSLGHDMIGLALGEALRDAEGKRSFRRAFSLTVFGSFIFSVCVILLAFHLIRENSIRRQNIEVLLAKSASNRAENMLVSLEFAKQAEMLSEQATYGFTKDNRPQQALGTLISGLPVIAHALQSVPPLEINSTIYPTYALPKRMEFAILRSRGVLEIASTENGVASQKIYNAIGPLQVAGQTSDLLSLSFSEVSNNLLLAMYVTSNTTKPGGIVVFSQSREPKLFSYDDLINVLGKNDTLNSTFLLYGLSGNSVILYRLNDDRSSVHLKSLVVLDSLELAIGIDRKMMTPSQSLLASSHKIVFYFYQNSLATVNGIPAFNITKLESNDIFKIDESHKWETKDFPSVQQCRQQKERTCDVTSVPHLQQSDLVVLGLSELVQDRINLKQKSVLSNLVIIDLNSQKITEIDLRVATLARQKCNFAGLNRTASVRPAGTKVDLRDEDIPTFLVKGLDGLVLGYTSLTSAQLINITSSGMTCKEIYFPDIEMAGWTSGNNDSKLFAASRNAGYIWDIRFKEEPASDVKILDELKTACSNQLAKFIGREDESSERNLDRKGTISKLCSESK